METTFRVPALAAAFAAFLQIGPAQAVDPYKDLKVEQRAVVDRIPSTPTTVSAPASALKMSTRLNRADGNYRPGESVTLTVETDRDSYIWVFDTGTSGRVHQLFPNRYAKDNFVRSGKPMILPAADAKYQFVASEPVGPELLTVIASPNKASLTDDLIDRKTGAGAFLALQGTAASLSKDIGITLKRDHPKAVVHHQVLRIVK